ncbi:uncharacterized protein DS421_11g335770 [Arachis hypogaea]|nr:uncharacterized protein DS421_11g335770 [Arachis hypogaea]
MNVTNGRSVCVTVQSSIYHCFNSLTFTSLLNLCFLPSESRDLPTYLCSLVFTYFLLNPLPFTFIIFLHHEIGAKGKLSSGSISSQTTILLEKPYKLY